MLPDIPKMTLSGVTLKVKIYKEEAGKGIPVVSMTIHGLYVASYGEWGG